MLTTETFNHVATIQYPVSEHRFARVVPDLLGTDRDLNSAHGPNEHILVTGFSERRLASQAPNHELTHLIGTIVPVRPSRPAGHQWYLNVDDNPRERGGGAYLEGARVSPTPVNGRLYLELSNQRDEPARFILRYNDEAHRDDRAHRDRPWTIVWGDRGYTGAVGQHRVVEPAMWVEVSATPDDEVGTPVTTGLATDEDIDTILSEPAAPGTLAPGTIGNEATGHTLGIGHVEEDGTVLLDPPLVVGEQYLVWYDRAWFSDHVSLGVATGANRFAFVGYYHRAVNGGVYYNDDAWHEPVQTTERHWVRLGMVVPEPVENEARVTELVAEAEASHEAFEDLNDALNDLARQQSWCGEYERTMDGIGMRSRRTGGRQPYDPDNTTARIVRHAWDIEVDVDLSVELESPGYRIENAIEYETGSLSGVSNLRFDATMSVTISGVVADTEEEARESITTAEVESEVDGRLSEGFTIDDWNITDVSEDTDFDWDDYTG